MEADPAGTDGDGRLADVAALAATVFAAETAVIASDAHGHHVLLAGVGPDAPARGPLPHDHPLVRCWDQHAPQLALPALAVEPCGNIRFHASVALHSRTGRRLGILAVFAREPRPAPTPAQRETLASLGRIAASLLERNDAERQAIIVAQVGEKAHEAVLIGNRHGQVIWQNRAAERLFGASLARLPLSSLFPSGLQSDPAASDAWLAGQSEDTRQLRVVAQDGSLRLLDATRSIWRHGPEQGTTLILHDVTEAASQRAQLDRLAHYDPLTGLPNRNALLAALDAHPDWGVALIAIDRFKWINDGLGHGIGDRVLQAFASRLQARTDADMGLARVGGDVFAIACRDARFFPAGNGEPLLPSLVQLLEKTLHVSGHAINADVSAGLALRSDVRDEGDLMACADLALYRAKAAGGRRLCQYTPAMRAEALTRRNMDLDLRRAFAQDEFEVHYQPQIDLRTGRICGAEALLRWRHPLRGMVPAFEFIDLLARGPLGAEVGAWVMQRACLDAAQWPDGEASISINLFPAQLGEQLVAQVADALAAAGLPAERLELEITENIALLQDSSGSDALGKLRSRGVNLAFDDFGTGYASLSMLQRFRIDRVKIDRSFVGGMLENSEDAAIVRWILMLARALGLRVVAEGVEQVEQAEWLHNHGCEEAQGYLYAPALDAATLLLRMREQQLETQQDG